MPRRPRTVFHYKVDHVLRDHPVDASAYEALLADPRTTVDAAHAWLTARGHACSRSAVARHRRRQHAAGRRQRDGAHLAVAFATAAKQHGLSDFTNAILLRHQMLLLDHLFVDVEDLDDLGFDKFLEIGRCIDLHLRQQRTLWEMGKLPASPNTGPGSGASLPAPAPEPTEEERAAALKAEFEEILGHPLPPPSVERR